MAMVPSSPSYTAMIKPVEALWRVLEHSGLSFPIAKQTLHIILGLSTSGLETRSNNALLSVVCDVQLDRTKLADVVTTHSGTRCLFGILRASELL